MRACMSARPGDAPIGREQPDGLSGSLNMFQRYDAFTGAGSWFGGAQVGYDYMLPNRVVIGGVADFSAPSWQSINRISIGGASTFISPTLGQESLSETVLGMGTVRGRVGYAPGQLVVLCDRRLCLGV